MRGTFTIWPDEVRRPIRVPGGEAFVAYPGGGDVIQHAGGTWSPAAFTYVETPADAQLPTYVVECTHDDRDLPRVDAVHIVRRPSGREIRSVDLRRMRPVEDVIADAWRFSADRRLAFVGDSEEAVQAAMQRAVDAGPGELLTTVKGLRRQARRRVTPDLLEEVAQVYRAHTVDGAPTKAVAEHFGLAPSTASLYVKRARDAGLDLPRGCS